VSNNKIKKDVSYTDSDTLEPEGPTVPPPSNLGTTRLKDHGLLAHTRRPAVSSDTLEPCDRPATLSRWAYHFRSRIRLRTPNGVGRLHGRHVVINSTSFFRLSTRLAIGIGSDPQRPDSHSHLSRTTEIWSTVKGVSSGHCIRSFRCGKPAFVSLI